MSLRALLGLGAAMALGLAAAPAPAQTAGIKVAVIDVQSIITESQAGKAVLEGLEQFGREQQERLEARGREIEELRKRISEGQLSLAEEKLNELRSELETKSIEAQRARDDARREFNRRQEEALKGFERRVMPVIQQVGQQGGYTMIFRKFESGLVYADEAIDITAEVIAALDASPEGG